MATEIQIEQGDDPSIPMQATVDGSTPSTAFLLSDSLNGWAWLGTNQPILFNLAVAWIDVTVASFSVSFTSAQTASLAPGIYFLQAQVTRGSNEITIADKPFEITASPGTAAAIPTYSAVQDAIQYGGTWLKDLLADKGTGGLIFQLGRARTRLDEIILGHYRPRRPGGRRDLLIDPSFLLIPNEAPNSTIQGYLDSNYLMVRPRTIEICSHLALQYLCEQQFTGGKDDPYLGRARYHQSRAANVMKGYKAELDINQDGWADIVIPLTYFSIR